jgi:hypothetical protein
MQFTVLVYLPTSWYLYDDFIVVDELTLEQIHETKIQNIGFTLFVLLKTKQIHAH